MSFERTLSPISDHSQLAIIPVLLRYCEENARDPAIVYSIYTGLCHGLIILEAYACAIHDLDEKRELPLPKDDLFWLTQIKHRLLTWKPNQPFPRDPENPFVQDIERFLSNLISLGNYVYRPLTLAWNDLETLLLDTQNRTFKLVHNFAAPMIPDEITCSLESILPPNTWTLIGAGKHSSSLYYQHDNYVLSNPNDRQENRRFESTEKGKRRLGIELFIAHNKFNLFKFSQFTFNSYRFAKKDEEIKTELTPPRILLEPKDPVIWSKIINEQAKNWENFSILHHAIYDNVPVPYIQYLLEGGANPNVKNEDGLTPLHILIASHDRRGEHTLEILDLLLQKKVDPSIRDNRAISPRFYALFAFSTYYNQPDQLNKTIIYDNILKKLNVSATAIENIKKTKNISFILDTFFLQSELASYVLKNEFNSSVRDFLNEVMYGVEIDMAAGQFESTFHDLQNRVKNYIKKVPDKGNFLLFCIENKLDNLAALWIKYLRDVLEIDAQDSFVIATQFLKLARAIITLSQYYCETQIAKVKSIIEESIAIFRMEPLFGYQKLKEDLQNKLWLPNKTGITPLVWAARMGLIDFVADLLDPPHQLDVNHRDNGKSALYFAVLRHDEKLVTILLKAGATLPGDYAFNPLLHALRSKQFSVAKKLVKDFSFDWAHTHFYDFKKLDNLAQRLIDAISMYRSSLYFISIERNTMCETILSIVNDAYDVALRTQDFTSAYQQLLFGSAQTKGILALINETASSHKQPGYLSNLFSQPKKSQSRLEIELTNALTESGLSLIFDENNNITDAKSSENTKRIDCLARFKQKIETQEYKQIKSTTLEKIRILLGEYGFSSPAETIDLIHAIAKNALTASDEKAESNDAVDYFFKESEKYIKKSGLSETQFHVSEFEVFKR